MSSRKRNEGVLALKVDAVSEKKLNNIREVGYKIYPVAQESPFLDAQFPKDKELNKSVLKKLKSVSEQIIRLDLNGTNMDDDMMSVINNLPHLQKLFLQNTKITDKGLRNLEGLNYLEYLNLYGTEITDEGLNKMPPLPRLRNLFLWQTKTTKEGIANLKNKQPHINIESGAETDIFDDAALMPPLIVAETDIFKDSLKVELKMNFKGANIYYTLDGSTPDSSSLKYEDQPIVLNSSSTVKAIAQKTGWKSSDPVSKFFPRAKYAIKNINVSPKPNERYKGKGATTLFDLEKGSSSFTDNKWLGYEKSHATLTVDLGEIKEVSRLTLGVMENTGSYIFFPKGMEIAVSENGSNYKTVVTKTYPTTEGPTPPELTNFTESFDLVNARYLKVKVKSNLVNPDWHPAPGAGCWIFLDEVIVE